jgi:hypothetical protein
VAVGPLGEASYRNVLRRQCRLRGIDYDERAADHLLTRLHPRNREPLLASYPYELLGRIADFASFEGTEPSLTPATVEQAWSSMFAICTNAAKGQVASLPTQSEDQ